MEAGQKMANGVKSEVEHAGSGRGGRAQYLLQACSVCGRRSLRYAFSIDNHRLVRCQNCGTMMLNPQPSDEALAAIYSEEYVLLQEDARGAAHVSDLKRRTARLYLDLLREYRGGHGGRLLEIGCGQGDFLVEAVGCGYEVVGTDVSPHVCRIAAQRVGGGGAVHCGSLETLDAGPEGFDVVVLADVIEHVRNPGETLQRIHGLLRPGGTIFVATPAMDSWSAQFMGHRWMEFKLEHLTYLDRSNIQTLLLRAGFDTLVVESNAKYLSFAYINAHFQKYKVKWISGVMSGLSHLLPDTLQWLPLRTVASGMIVMGTRGERRARPRLSVVVPAYNEAGTLAEVLDQLVTREFAEVDAEVIVVESGSTDGTREIARAYAKRGQVKLIEEETPRGKGHAVRTGLAACTGDVILIQDADLEYDIEDYDALLQPILSGHRAFVLGARHGEGGWKLRKFEDQPLLASLLNVGHWGFTFLVNFLFGVWLRDPMTMYKVFRRDCLTGLRFTCNRFDFDYELLTHLIRKGYRPLEIPVNYHSRSFQHGKKIRPLTDPWNWLWALARLRFTRVNPLRNLAAARKAS